MLVSLCAGATWQWQYSAIGELEGDVLTMRGAVLSTAGTNGWMLDTTGAVQVDDVTWFSGSWNATALRAASCVVSAENAGTVGYSIQERNGEIWAMSGVPFTANGDALLRRRPDGTWATVISIPGATTFWVNSETDIWLPHGQSVTHFDGQGTTTELLPAPSGSGGHWNTGIWVSPGGVVWVTVVFNEPARDHAVSQVLKRTVSGWETVLSVDEESLRVFGGAGEAVWIIGDGAVRRWDGSTLTLEDTGSTDRWKDGLERDDESTVLVGEKGAVMVRSPEGRWRSLAVKTSVSFTSVTRAAKGRLILGTSASCTNADHVCPTIPPTTDDPARTPPTLGAACRLPGTISPGCSCGAGPSLAAAWLLIVLLRLLRPR